MMAGNTVSGRPNGRMVVLAAVQLAHSRWGAAVPDPVWGVCRGGAYVISRTE